MAMFEHSVAIESTRWPCLKAFELSCCEFSTIVDCCQLARTCPEAKDVAADNLLAILANALRLKTVYANGVIDRVERSKDRMKASHFALIRIVTSNWECERSIQVFSDCCDLHRKDTVKYWAGWHSIHARYPSQQQLSTDQIDERDAMLTAFERRDSPLHAVFDETDQLLSSIVLDRRRWEVPSSPP